jgi:hypothetical protein
LFAAHGDRGALYTHILCLALFKQLDDLPKNLSHVLQGGDDTGSGDLFFVM